MTNNFSKTEKSLKRYLKEKVKITAATVVSFLIAGTVTIGADFNPDNNITVGEGDFGAISIKDTTTNASVEFSGTTMKTYGEQKDTNNFGEIFKYTEGEKEETLLIQSNGEVEFEGGFLDKFITFDKENGKLEVATNASIGGRTSKKTALVSANKGQNLTVDVQKDKKILVKSYGIGIEALNGANVSLSGEGKIEVKDNGIGIKVAKEGDKGATSKINLGSNNLEITSTATKSQGIGIRVEEGMTAEISGKLNAGKGIGIEAVDGNVILTEDADLSGNTSSAIVIRGRGATKIDTTATTLNGKIDYVSQDDAKGEISTGVLGNQAKIAVSGTGSRAGVIINTEIGDKTAVGALNLSAELDNDITVNLTGETLKTNGLVSASVKSGRINVITPENFVIESSGRLFDITTNNGNVIADFSKGAIIHGTVTNGTSTINAGNIEVYGKLAAFKNAAGTQMLTLTGIEGNEITIKDNAIGLVGNSDGISVLDIEKGVNVSVEKGGILLSSNGNTEVDILKNKGTITLENVNKDSGDVSKLTDGVNAIVINSGVIVLTGYDDNVENATLESIAKYLSNEEVIRNQDADVSIEGLGIFKNGKNEIIYAGGEIIDRNNEVSALKDAAETTGHKGFKYTEEVTIYGEGTIKNAHHNIMNKVTFGSLDKDLTGGTVVLDNSELEDNGMVISTYKDSQTGETIEGQITFRKQGSGYLGNVLVEGEAEDGEQFDSAAIVFYGESEDKLGNFTFAGKLLNDTERTSIRLGHNASDADNVVRTLLCLGAEIEKDNGEKEYIDTVINGNIVAELAISNGALKHEIETKGNVTLNGAITNVKNITAGTDEDKSNLVFTSEAKIVSTTKTGAKTVLDKTANGNIGIQIGENGDNLFKNSKIDGSNKGISLGTGVDKIEVLTDVLTSNVELDLGDYESVLENKTYVDSDYYGIVIDENTGKHVIKYGAGLSDDNWNLLIRNSSLYDAFFASQNIFDMLGGNNFSVDKRLDQLDELINSNIYSETVKMSMDTLRMNEDAVLSINARPEERKWAAAGKVLYSSSDYDRDGIRGDYNVDTENTGLMGAVEYGLTNSSSVGFAFSGVKQDMEMGTSDADGEAFYLGVYRKDNFKNIEMTTGVGYQLNSIDANHITGNNDFDSTAFSGYVQGKYHIAINDDTTVSPVGRLAVTKFNQESIDNGRMTMDEVDGTYADIDLGVEVAKRYAMEDGTAKLFAGITYTHTLGDVNDDYKVKFINKAGVASDAVTVKGAEFGENTMKLDLGADYEKDNGFMVNGGLYYEFDDNNRTAISVTLGAGYRF